MPTLLLLFELKPEQIEQIRDIIPDWTIVSGDADSIADEYFLNAEIVLGWNSRMEAALDSAARLKWVQTSSAGVDKLPLDKLRDRGIYLTSASGIHPVSMAETLFAMLLAFSRNLHHAIRQQSRGQWKASERYHQLAGRTMGIIGVGVIGEEVARLGKAFGMRTLGVRRSAKPVEAVDEMYGMEQLDFVLAQSDVIVNILPYTEETHHLFDAGRFDRMQSHALFFNMGRGASVDTDALVEALANGAIGGAGLDVFETEPLPSDHPLWTMDNVIITPHIGGWTSQYKQKVTDIFTSNLRNYAAGERPGRNLVDYGRNY
ncbi:D-2-hydroxyacid dehydrogenase [Cohnella terricola]|uniref:D-2-hydroxyacid dehydrogenase n=1 Tax=Cohnella terricola TaxID=1289167 RepID=A0A559JWE0_9BACL|nr:D-2-hydroxyacid dehydrogenase [Cohnella terricola]TVY04147.1 D-2-hydroxyacid dehydrogenase [Cohnella terricola]